MWKLEILRYKFYNIFYYFFIYSFFGWIYESCYVSFHKEEWKSKWTFTKFPEFADHIKELIAENKERLIDNNRNREGFEFKTFRLEIENHMKEFAGKYQRKYVYKNIDEI